MRIDQDVNAAVTGSTPVTGSDPTPKVENRQHEVELPEHEQLDITVRPHRFHHHSLGLVIDEPCAIPGINLSDYTSPLPRPGWGDHCTMALAPVTLTNGVTFPVNARITELVTLIMNANIAQGYGYRHADTGSYNCRKISGSSQWSVHAWALAIDENWQTNPQASPLHTDRPAWEVRRWMRYGFAWGGNYVAPAPTSSSRASPPATALPSASGSSPATASSSPSSPSPSAPRISGSATSPSHQADDRTPQNDHDGRRLVRLPDQIVAYVVCCARILGCREDGSTR